MLIRKLRYGSHLILESEFYRERRIQRQFSQKKMIKSLLINAS